MSMKLLKASPAVVALFGSASIASILSYYIVHDSLELPFWMVVLRWAALVMVLVLFSVYSLLLRQPERGQYQKAIALGGALAILASMFFPSMEFATNFALASIGLATAYTMGIMVVGLRRLKNIDK